MIFILTCSSSSSNSSDNAANHGKVAFFFLNIHINFIIAPSLFNENE